MIRRVLIVAAKKSPGQQLPQQQASAAPSQPAAIDIDATCNMAGAIPNCKEEVAKMIAAQVALPRHADASASPSSSSSARGNCKSDWRGCSSNADLMNNFGDITRG